MKKWKAVCKKAGPWIYRLLTLILILTLASVINDKVHHRAPQILGYSVFRITTGSMEPTIPTGMYILVKETPAMEIRKGDIITFYSKDPEIYGMPNTHRVADKPLRTSRGMIFATRGDANSLKDGFYVNERQVIGRYCCSLPNLTKLVNLFMTREMLISLLIIQGMGLILLHFSEKILKKSKEERQQLKDAQEARIRQLQQEAVEAYLRQQSENAETTEQKEIPEDTVKTEAAETLSQGEEPADGKEQEGDA